MLLTSSCNVQEPAPFGAITSKAQVEWQKKEYTMFVHFGPKDIQP